MSPGQSLAGRDQSVSPVNCHRDGCNGSCCLLLYTFWLLGNQNILYTPTTPKDGLNTMRCTVLSRGLIYNYRHQNGFFSKGTHQGCCLHCPLQFQSCPSLGVNNLDKWKQSRSVLTPTQSSFCLVQIKEERPGSTTTGAWVWIGRRCLGSKNSIVPPSVVVHGQGCVFHHIIHW